MKSSYKKYVRIYYAALICAIFVFVAFSIFVSYISESPLEFIIPAAGVLFVFSLLLPRFIRKKMLTQFYKNLDSKDFMDFSKDKILRSTPDSRAAASMHAGDYQNVINIVTAQLKNKKLSIIEKFHYLGYLSQAYFELRDFEKLEIVLAKYDEYCNTYSMNEPNTSYDFYRNFLNHDYDACLSHCAESKATIPPNSKAAKYLCSEEDYYTAVTLFEKGDTLGSKEIFESVITTIPNMYIAILAQKYIDAVDSGEPPVMSETEILPQDNAIAKNRFQIIKKICTTVLLCIIAGVAIYTIGNTKDEATLQFEARVNDELLELYENAVFIDYFELNADDDFVGGFCLANIEDELSLFQIGSYDEWETFAFFRVGNEIVTENNYYEVAPLSDYYLGYIVTEEKPSTKSLKYSFKFKNNGTTYWLCVDRIETNEDDSVKEKIIDALSRKYDNATLIDNFHLRYGGVYFGTFCLVNANDKLILLEATSYDAGKYFNVWEIKSGIDENTAYTVLSPVSERYITFIATQYEPAYKNIYYKIKLEYNPPLWFYVYSIKQKQN